MIKKIITIVLIFFTIVIYANACLDDNDVIVEGYNNTICSVFQNETGQPTDEAECKLTLYNESNSIYINAELMDENQKIYFYNLTSNYTVGTYHYYIECNQSSYYGLGVGSFRVKEIDLYEEWEMIAIVMLYLGLIAIGYWFSQTGNYWIGLPFLIATVPFNFYFWREWEGHSLRNVLGVAFAALTFGSIVMFLFVRSKSGKR